MQRQHLNRLISWQATLLDVTAKLRRPKVTAVLCKRCRKWVKPRRWNPALWICNTCVRDKAQGYYVSRGYYAPASEAAAAIAQAHHRAHEKELRQFRRHAAHLTAAQPRPRLTGAA